MVAEKVPLATQIFNKNEIDNVLTFQQHYKEKHICILQQMRNYLLICSSESKII
jgi:hypothetical protein